MLLSAALFALFMMGFWLYCLTDAILTPAAECRGLRKSTWIAVIAGTLIGGAVAWIIVRRPARDCSVPLVSLPRGDLSDAGDERYAKSPLEMDAHDALARHPAGRARVADAAAAAPKGPDDDADFLRELARVIRRNPPVSLHLT
jgi:hypothetical protein